MKEKIKSSNILVFLLFLTVVLIVYRGTLNNHSLLVAGDGIGYYLSKHFLVNALATGEIPLWNPFVALGTPFLADIQQTVFSPLNIIYLLFDTIIGFNIFHVLQLTLAGFFMFLYINEVFNKKSIAIFIGFIFSFSSMIGGNRIEHTVIITTILFFPLILFFLERFKNTRKDKYLIFSSIGMAVHFLSGFTQIVIYFDIIFFIYYIYICRYLKLSMKMVLINLFKWVTPYILLCAVQLIPTLQLMQQSGRDNVSIEFTSILAYDLRILIMMLFPYVFLDKFESFGSFASSGIDIEIYIGIIPLIYLLYSIIYHHKDKFVRLISSIMIGAFIFGMAPNIPYINKIVHVIPIIGSFRAYSRILSVFLICGLILLGYTLSKLDEKSEVRRLIKFSSFFTLFIVLNMFLITSVFSQPGISSELSAHYAWDGKVFLSILFISLINLLSLFFLYTNNKRKYVQQLILGLLCIVTIVDVGKYSILKGSNSIDEVLNVSTPKKIEELIVDENDNYRFFALSNSPKQYYDKQLKIAKLQRNVFYEEKFYNSYLTFIDQKFKNYGIDETGYYPNTTNVLQTRNDLISMMSIRYILDAWNQEFSQSIPTDEIEENLLSERDIPIFNNDSQLSAKNYSVKLEPNTAYEVTIKMSISELPYLFYVDFYTDTYDDPQQDGLFNSITSGTNEYSVIIHTGNDVPSGNVNFRIISQSTTDIHISNVSVDKVKTAKAYKPILKEDGIVVYENANAKPILYTPSYVKSIKSYESLYTDNNKSLHEYSFIENFSHDIDLSQTNTEITNIIQKINSVSAVVTSDKDTFINHSQLSYPGWKAYVDGVEVPIYNVNNLIQGAEVPAGTHQITFIYDPIDVKLGAFISLLGVLLCCFFLFYPSLRERFKERA